MTDYTLTKETNRQTGELPDKVTVILPRPFAWWVVKQLILALSNELGLARENRITIDLLGKLEKVSKP